MKSLLSWLKSRLGKTHTRILSGMLLVSGFVFVGKIAGALKEMVLAFHYGVGQSLDIYVLAFVMVTWLPGVLTSVVNAVLVPLINRLSANSRVIFSEQLSGTLLAAGCMFGLVLAIVAPGLSGWFAQGFSSDAQVSFHSLLKVLVVGTPLLFLISFYSSLLLAREKHANTLLESVPAVILMVFVLLWPGPSNLQPLLWGTLVGWSLQLVALMILVRRHNISLRMRFGFGHEAWSEFSAAIGTLLIGTILMSLVIPVDQFLAGQLNPGSISSLSYATRLLALGLGLGATAIGRAILPVLSDPQLSIQQRSHIAQRWVGVLFAGGLVASVVGWLLAPIMVKVLFERGAFTAADTARVAEVVQYGMAQLPVYFSGIILVQLFASMSRYRVIVYSSALALAVKLVTGIPLAHWFGVKGITLSTAFMYFSTCAYFLWQLKQVVPKSRAK